MIFLILNWNNYIITKKCILRIFEYEPLSSILIIDNGSCENEKMLLEQFAIENEFEIFNNDNIIANKCRNQRILSLLQLPNNIGYANSNNIALKICKKLGYEYAIVMNNDVFINYNITDTLQKIVNKNEYGLIGIDIIQNGKNINPIKKHFSYYHLIFYKILWPVLLIFEYLWRMTYRNTRQKGNCNNEIVELRRNEYLSGSLLVCNLECMEKVGYFDKKTFLFYEDLIITEKMQKKRIKCVYYPGLQAIHIHSATTRKVNWREIEKYHHESNKYYLYKYKNISEYGMAMIDISEIIWENTWLHIKTIINNLNSVMSHYELNKSN